MIQNLTSLHIQYYYSLIKHGKIALKLHEAQDPTYCMYMAHWLMHPPLYPTQLHYLAQKHNTMHAPSQSWQACSPNSFSSRNPDSPVTIAVFVDSSSAIAVINNESDTKRTRHIQRRIHFVRQSIFFTIKMS